MAKSTGGASFDMDATGAYGVMGTIDGFQARVKTPFYINSVLKLAHSRLSDFFDAYLDGLASANPDSYMHVYEWPQRFRNYQETVGNPARPDAKLWVHTFNGRGGQGQASFQFLPSTHPVPVDPILTTPGPGGRAVKTGIHVFVWKTQVMEYGLPVKITPKLSEYLAYVANKKRKGFGQDSDPLRHPNMPEDQGGDVMLSKGPVDITRAGGKNTWHKFTTAFQDFYKTVALEHLMNDILPGVESDLSKTVRMQMAQNSRTSIKAGQMRGKKIGISAWASMEKQSFGSAKRRVEAALRKNEDDYIKEAERRRRRFYNV